MGTKKKQKYTPHWKRKKEQLTPEERKLEKEAKRNAKKWKAAVKANPISEYGPPPSAPANGMYPGILKWFYFECH